jgi:ABC-type nitrate/sulfonate/bicarbonate transport system substrate-binding protein
MGFFEKEGFEAKLELLYPVTKTYEELREGRLDFVGGAAHAALYAFKDWKGARLLCALAQHMYWFLVVRKDLNARRGDLTALKNLRIGAAPGPVDGLKRMLQRAGIDPARDVKIGPVPGFTVGQTASFGLLAAKALEEGKIDGFWANGMGAEVALRNSTGTLVLDARRDGSEEIRGYTFPALVARADQDPKAAAAAIRAVHAAQQALKEDPNRATAIGRKLFPPAEAAMIAELIRRDAPFYDPSVSEKTLNAMNQFARDIGLLSRPVHYGEVLWKG